jgi:two-component system, sensor histidine kinase and response regulator
MAKILVIEDEESVLDIICELLLVENFEVLRAENGEIGLRLALEEVPDLIICDIMMPKLSGYEVLGQLQRNPKTQFIPFIFLSARAAKDDQRQGMNLGADDYVTKPFTREQLLGAITSRLRKQETLTDQSRQQLDQLRNQLAATLPHELRTPLQGILTSAELLTMYWETLERSEIRDIVDSIKESAKRLYQLIEKFLQYTQIEIAASDPGQRRSLLAGEISSGESIIRAVVRDKAKEYQREADVNLTVAEIPSLSISERWLITIISELIDNAFKFSRQQTPVIINSNLEGDQLILTIANQGRGMTAQQIRNIGAYIQFDRQFYEQQGSGLGLTIAKRLIELHGGKLEINSIPQQETIVKVFLPIVIS